SSTKWPGMRISSTSTSSEILSVGAPAAPSTFATAGGLANSEPSFATISPLSRNDHISSVPSLKLLAAGTVCAGSSASTQGIAQMSPRARVGPVIIRENMLLTPQGGEAAGRQCEPAQLLRQASRRPSLVNDR